MFPFSKLLIHLYLFLEKTFKVKNWKLMFEAILGKIIFSKCMQSIWCLQYPGIQDPPEVLETLL